MADASDTATTSSVTAASVDDAPDAGASTADATAAAAAAAAAATATATATPAISFKVQWSKESLDVTLSPDATIGELKALLATRTGVPVAMQKVMKGGPCKDGETLAARKIVAGAKVMLIGSRPADVDQSASAAAAAAAAAPTGLSMDDTPASKDDTPLCERDEHRRIVAKGVPEDAEPGDRTRQRPLPTTYLSAIVTKGGTRVRLTFKDDVGQLWIGSASSTQKIPYGAVRNVVVEAISGAEDYSIVGLQVGPSENNMLWLYWVPSQFTRAIANTIQPPSWF